MTIDSERQERQALVERDKLWDIVDQAERNQGRLTADESMSLDYALDQLDEWIEQHDARVVAEGTARALENVVAGGRYDGALPKYVRVKLTNLVKQYEDEALTHYEAS